MKNDLRKDRKAHRAALAAADPQAGERLKGAFIAADVWPEVGAVVAGYMPIGSEIDPRPLMAVLATRGHGLALPVISADKSTMTFHVWKAEDALETGPMGIRQPLQNVPEVTPDIVLVPLLAFDRRGGRLGYGGGFYDRALHYHRRTKNGKGKAIQCWGMAFSAQEIDAVPTEPHDQPLDAVLTERGLIEIRKT